MTTGEKSPTRIERARESRLERWGTIALIGVWIPTVIAFPSSFPVAVACLVIWIAILGSKQVIG